MALAFAPFPSQPLSDLACIGPYEVVGTIAEGGMGIVLRGQHVRDGRKVALKTVRSQRTSDQTGIRREIAVLGELYHPGIVRLIDDGTAGGLPWLAMELLSGETVCDRIAALRRQKAPLGPATSAHVAEALRIAAQLCRALDYVHERGLVHRDVKPANVFVARDGRVTLLDFGLVCVSQVCAPELRAAELCVGTMEYAAPEQMRGEPVDARADIFSVGCVLYELITGRRPGEDDGGDDCETGDDTQPGWRPVNTARLPARPPALSSALPPELHALLSSMLAERREDRPSGAGRIAGKLERLAAQLYVASAFTAATA